MEILKDEVATDTPQAQPTEDSTAIFRSNFDKAQGIAKNIHELMIGQWFTPLKLSSYSKMQMNKVDQDLRFISAFFLLEEKVSLGVKSFRIIMDAKERLDFIQAHRQSLMQQLGHFDLCSQLISEQID